MANNKKKKAKKEKKVMSVAEAVGDTSGFEEKVFDKKRKMTVIYGVIGIVIIIVFIIFFVATPRKVTFNYQDLATKSTHYVINTKTSTLDDAPQDSTLNKTYYEFGGWYLNKACTSPSKGLFNNNDDDSLLTYEFSKFTNVTLYAKWIPVEYTVTYDVVGNIKNLSLVKENELKKINLSRNPSTYTVKHELADYEKTEYMAYLRTQDLEKYVNSKRAYQNCLEALELYNNNSKLDHINLQNISLSDINQTGYTFDHWEDAETGEAITYLDKVDPKNITVRAVWVKN